MEAPAVTAWATEAAWRTKADEGGSDLSELRVGRVVWVVNSGSGNDRLKGRVGESLAGIFLAKERRCHRYHETPSSLWALLSATLRPPEDYPVKT